MNVFVSLVAVLGLVVISTWGISAWQLHGLFGVVLPYSAITLFILGFLYRVYRWASTPVPFNIPTTCGQQRSLDWIPSSRLESPSSTLGVLGRMALEVLFFRSLFRNTTAELKPGPRLVYGSNKYLWAAALAFHWSFLVVFLRHFRFFAEPVPAWVNLLQWGDSFFEIGVPAFFMTDAALLAALTFLFLRRVLEPKLRYISLPADYFVLFLLLAIATSGVLMRYWLKVDVTAVKELMLGLLAFRPTSGHGIGTPFYVHFFLVSVLIAYFPFSKLMHLGGVVLSPTRNLSNDSRRVRHINPWNYPVKVHTYEEWEHDFRDRLVEAELPLDKE